MAKPSLDWRSGNLNRASRLSIIIFSALIVQILCRYYSGGIWGGQFHAVRFALRFLVPVAANLFFLRVSWPDMGIRLPQIARKDAARIAMATALMAAGVSLIRFSPAFGQYYANWRVPGTQTAVDFALFTVSTIPGWEFLHRSFLLFGIIAVLSRDDWPCADSLKISTETSQVLAVLVVASFEALFHLTKPPLEAFGMLIASPILSMIALRTRSIFIPLAIHLAIEGVFFYLITRGSP